MALFVCALATEATQKVAYPISHVDDTLNELKDEFFYTHLDLASAFWQFRVKGEDVPKTQFQSPDKTDEMGGHAFRIVQCSSDLRADDERNFKIIFSHVW
jgi:hypothetical protein